MKTTKTRKGGLIVPDSVGIWSGNFSQVGARRRNKSKRRSRQKGGLAPASAQALHVSNLQDTEMNFTHHPQTQRPLSDQLTVEEIKAVAGSETISTSPPTDLPPSADLLAFEDNIDVIGNEELAVQEIAKDPNISVEQAQEIVAAAQARAARSGGVGTSSSQYGVVGTGDNARRGSEAADPNEGRTFSSQGQRIESLYRGGGKRRKTRRKRHNKRKAKNTHKVRRRKRRRSRKH